MQTGCGLDRARRVSRKDLIAEDVFGFFVEALCPAVDNPEILAVTCRQDREVRTHGALDESRSTTTTTGLPVDGGHDLPRQGYRSLHFHGRSIRSNAAELAVADIEAYTASEDIVADPTASCGLPTAEERAQLIRGALRDALALLTERLGGNRSRWSWERLHTVTFRNHISSGRSLLSRILGAYFNRGSYPYTGGRHTVNNSWFDLRDPFATTQISSYRFIVDMAHPEQAFAINHTGQSDIPASAHYDDMTAPWRRGEYHPLTASDKDAGGETGSALMLVP